MIYGTVLCLGDSILFGARSPLGPPEYLAPLLNADTDETRWAVLNRSISGQTTRQILDRAPGAVRELVSMGGSQQVVILAGTNDSKGGGLGHPEWETLYRQLVDWPARYELPVVLCTYPPVAPSKTMPRFTAKSPVWLDEASRRVRAIVAENEPTGLVRLAELSDMPVGFLADGVHMRPDGYRWIATRIAKAMGFKASEPAVGLPTLAEKVIAQLGSKPEPAAQRRRIVRGDER